MIPLQVLQAGAGAVSTLVGTNSSQYGSWYQPPLYGHAPIKSQTIADATGISLLSHNPLARQLALTRRMNLFVVDDNDGAVRWGDRGQLDVKISWVSNTQLLVQYPAKARVFQQEASYQSTTVRYVPSP